MRHRLLPLAALVVFPATLGLGGEELESAPLPLLPVEAMPFQVELRQSKHRGIVARVLDTPDRTEITTLGVLPLTAAAEGVLHQMRDLEGRRGDVGVLAAGRFGPTPSARDLVALSLEAGDLRALKKCRVGDCDLRMSSEWITRFRDEIDWSSHASGELAATLWRDMLVGYAAAYSEGGNSALPEYDDGREPLRVAESLATLSERFDGPLTSFPEIRRYLREFPAGRPPGTEDFLYWLKEKVWFEVVTSIHHVTIVERTVGSNRVVLATSKQIYASHYFDSALALTAFVEAEGASYLVQLTRSRSDIRPGFSWPQRVLIRRLVRGRLEQRLAALKGRLEASPEVAADRGPNRSSEELPPEPALFPVPGTGRGGRQRGAVQDSPRGNSP